MGSRLAIDMYAWAPVLKSHRATATLVRMALTALDEAKGTTPAATYFGGHRSLAVALGYIDPHRLEVEPTRSQLNEVGLVIKELREVGAIEVVRRAGHGRAAVYRLHLRPVESVRRHAAPRSGLGPDLDPGLSPDH